MTKEEISQLERERNHYKNLYEEQRKELTTYQISQNDWKTIAQQLASYLENIK